MTRTEPASSQCTLQVNTVDEALLHTTRTGPDVLLDRGILVTGENLGRHVQVRDSIWGKQRRVLRVSVNVL